MRHRIDYSYTTPHTSPHRNTKPKVHSMGNAIKAAAQEYAALIGNMSEQDVLAAISAGNQSVLRGVLMLMGVAA